MAKRYAFPLLAFMTCWFYTSDSFAGDLKDESTLIKNSTNSVTIYSNSDDACQGKILPSNEHKILDFHSAWVDNIQTSRDAHIIMTKEIMSTAFLNAQADYPQTFRKKIYKIDSLTFYTPHGLTPTKVPGKKEFTPTKNNNIKRMFTGKAPVYAGNVKIQIHHVAQNDVGAAIPLPVTLHKAKDDPLHFNKGPSNVTRTGKGGFESSKKVFYRELTNEMLKELETQYPTDYPELEKVLLGEHYDAWKKHEKKELNKKEIEDKENNPPIVATKKKNVDYLNDPTINKKQKTS